MKILCHQLNLVHPLPHPPVLSMPSSNQGWPEDFGFQLGGHGPSYILSVEEGSSAHLAGLQAGDQVLEIEGNNVSTLGPQAVIAIAQTQKNVPPSIGVVSRIQQVQQLFNQMHVVLHALANVCRRSVCFFSFHFDSA